MIRPSREEMFRKWDTMPVYFKQSAGCVYIMSRADGWHKIGLHLGRNPKSRVRGVQRAIPSHMRPVKVMRSWFVGFEVVPIERLAHQYLERLGYERDILSRGTEWFNVPYRVAFKTIKQAIADYDNGVRPTVQKRRSKNYKSDAAVIREAKGHGISERMMRGLGKSGRS